MAQGDILARGGKSATFGPPKVTQEKWDAIWAEDKKPAREFDKQDQNVKEATNG